MSYDSVDIFDKTVKVSIAEIYYKKISKAK